jgi:hypothetical protein
MESDSVTVSRSAAERLANLAFPARVLAILYLLVGIALLAAAYFDIRQAMDSQRNRVPYAVVMYASFVVVFALAAFQAWQTAGSLVSLAQAVTKLPLEQAIKHVHDMLMLFFGWLILLVGALIVAMLLSAY